MPNIQDLRWSFSVIRDEQSSWSTGDNLLIGFEQSEPISSKHRRSNDNLNKTWSTFSVLVQADIVEPRSGFNQTGLTT